VSGLQLTRTDSKKASFDLAEGILALPEFAVLIFAIISIIRNTIPNTLSITKVYLLIEKKFVFIYLSEYNSSKSDM